ncbi:LPO_1073/Vpar_1526 family protein [Pantoea vagans]|uniref:LPO_1073/Vpar_1526 family protein n=1 Tax=Pantoea vagans TaxID=470934 RepID=UPI00076B2422|nr:LPO_1073/Vpar_1526 family protein [Pantoea vagans]
MVLLQQIARLTVKADQHDEQRGTFSRRQEISLVQSAGDLVQVDTKTVEVIVKGILYDSLPKFQENAKNQVQTSIRNYVDDLIKELEIQKTRSDVINEKLPTPDIQYSIFESAKAYARSPERADKDTLINLVVNKTNTNSDDLDELSELDMAIEAASKMNTRQIKTLAFVHFTINIVKFGLSPQRGYLPMGPAMSDTCKEQDGYYLFHGEVARSKVEINNLYIDKYTR